MKVIANFAMTVDGKVTTRTGAPTTFTSAADKRRLREIRALGDVLLAGASTVRADSMSMGISDPALRRQREAAGKPAEPVRAIVSNSGNIGTDWNVFTNDRTPLHLFGSASAAFPAGLPPFCHVHIRKEPELSLRGVLEDLNELTGCRTVVCEGGPRVFASLIAGDLVDTLFLTLIPAVFGGRTAATLTGVPAGTPIDGPQFRIHAVVPSGSEVFLELRRRRGTQRAATSKK